MNVSVTFFFVTVIPMQTLYPAVYQPISVDKLQQVILPHVFKPARYLGLEEGAYNKAFNPTQPTMALVFPELYEIGISNHAHKLLYSVVNQQPAMLCDRAYAPDLDLKNLLAQHAIPLFAVETKMPLAAFDMLAISLQYELNYTTVLGTLEAAQIPFRAADRQADPNRQYPIIVGGGPGSTNPMPIAPFFDAFMVGDGEHVMVELLAAIHKGKHLPRPALLAQLAQIDGVYVPGVSVKAYKRIVDIAVEDVDVAPLIPTVGAVHDRVVVEARRGCDRMCRFCQPCFINLPVREQSVENITRKALTEVEKTGYDECSLLSLSIADYSHFAPMIKDVAAALAEQDVSLSLPSQRADRFSLEVAEAVQNVRKSTLTFAPEAGTPRLRDVINKNLTDEEIFNAVTTAYKAGWNKVKLYFMIGLPTETQADLEGIVSMVHQLRQACRQLKREPDLSIRHQLDLHLTLSNFVPKPHTPFQWFAQDTQAELKTKIAFLRAAFKGIPGVKVSFTDTELSKLEAVVSKGDVDLAPVFELAYRQGAYLDAWGGADALKAWFDALEQLGIDPEAYTRDRLVNVEDPLPWDAIDVGITKHWLQQEYRKAVQAASTTPCFDECSVCGVCATYSTQPKFIEVPKGGFKVKTVNTQRSQRLKAQPVCRLRLTIAKAGLLRFISHLDWLRLITRVLSRAKLPIAYTQGFNPKPKLSFSPALPLFAIAMQEYVDIELSETPTDIEALKATLNRHLPKNGHISHIELLPAIVPSIQKSIRSYGYSAIRSCKKDSSPVNIKERLASLHDQPVWNIAVDKNGKHVAHVEDADTAHWLDIRQYLMDDVILQSGNESVSFSFNVYPCVVSQTPGLLPRYVNPKWLLSKIDPDADWQLTRTGMVLATL
jgi:radical SAM-linked protein